jgi:hypothetical protein
MLAIFETESGRIQFSGCKTRQLQDFCDLTGAELCNRVHHPPVRVFRAHTRVLVNIDSALYAEDPSSQLRSVAERYADSGDFSGVGGQ